MSERFYWKARMGRGTPYIGVVTWFGMPVVDNEPQDRSWTWQCLVRTETTSRLVEQGDSCPIAVEGVSLRNVESITEAEWRFLTDHARWATAHAPDHPAAAPNTAIDWNRTKIRF